MITRNRKSSVCLILIVAVVCTLLVVALLPLLAQAAPPALPPRPKPPQLPTPTPRPSKSPSGKPAGAFIELHVRSTRTGLWAVVQWEDDAGGWHDVEGWRGTLDEGNKKVWWVSKADFDKGPFCWVVYQGERGELLAESESFYLPHYDNETVLVEVALVP